MSSIKRFSPGVIAILTLIFAVSGLSYGKNKSVKFPNVKIKNFGQMDERFFRGARPDEQDYSALAALGVTTIIDLTDNSKEYEQPAVERAGLRYINIPMVDKSRPTMDQISAFLKIIDDPATGKFYVHCAGGRHRTGVMGAVYRFTKNQWNLDQVLAEMDQYEFGSGTGHGKQRDFVKDYWEQFQAKATVTTATSSN